MDDLTPDLLRSKGSSYEELRNYLRLRGREAYLQKRVRTVVHFVAEVWVLVIFTIIRWQENYCYKNHQRNAIYLGFRSPNMLFNFCFQTGGLTTVASFLPIHLFLLGYRGETGTRLNERS